MHYDTLRTIRVLFSVEFYYLIREREDMKWQ